MSGLTAFLQTELLSLSSEARRKHPEIKEAAERLSAILRSFKERPGYSIANELSKSEDALRPFVLACETKQVKLVTIAIGCIQKLISFHAIPETSIRTVLRKLTDISVHGVEIQLKILQTVLPLLSNYRSVHDDILAEALLICFRLQDSKIIVVNNTAAATLRQLVIFVFDKVVKEDTEEPKEDEVYHDVELSSGETIALRSCAKDAYCLFQDLCLLTNGEPPEFLRLGHLSRTFGLELIESVLTNHHVLFHVHKELIGLLKERVCPLVIKNFSEKSEFPQTMRLTRVMYILIKQFSEVLVMECEIFLSMFVKILDPENPQWQRILAMEIFRGVCSDSMLLCSIFNWYDRKNSATNVFRDMITAFGRLATEKPQLIRATQGGRDSMDHASSSGTYSHLSSASAAGGTEATSPSLSAATSTVRIQCIDQLDKADPPSFPDTYIFYLVMLCLDSIADGLAGLVLPRFASNGKNITSATTRASATNRSQLVQSETTNKVYPPDTAADIKKDLSLVTEMANVAWPGLLATMSFYLSANLDEDLFHSLMRSYQNFTNVCGVLDLVVPRDAFLTNLCKNAIPSNPILSSGLLTSKSSSSTTSVVTSSSSTLAISYSDLPAQQQQLLANVTLNDKNLYCLRVLLNITMLLGSVLGPSWYLVLETLQQANFLLFGRPAAKGTSNSTTSLSVQSSRKNMPSSPNPSVTSLQSLSSGHQSSASLMEADHIAIIQSSFSRLFENSRYLDDKAFIAFAQALCRLSAEASGMPYQEDEASSANKSSRAKIFNNTSFAVEKLRYIAILNMGRLFSPNRDSYAWDLIMMHLIAAANYPQTPSSIRKQYCESIADIILNAMEFSLSEHKEPDENLQIRLLTALNQCINYTLAKSDPSSVTDNTSKSFVEVQTMGLETLNKLLQTSGHSFTCGWTVIFDMVKHVTLSCSNIPPDLYNDDEDASVTEEEKPTERVSIDTTASSIRTATHSGHVAQNQKSSSGLIKVAFASLQLICTDFLSLLSPDCLRQCIATLGAFCAQSDDLNISLTAVGLLWNLSDFIQTKRLDYCKEPDGDKTAIGDVAVDKARLNIDDPIEGPETPEVLSILWMMLLLQLAHTCTNWRPEVRNGANQTLFRTIVMNGNVLGTQLWHACIWEVLFPLLDSIKMSSIRASRMMQSNISKSPGASPSADRDSAGFMLHHSRDTADKQWDETKVLALAGISGIFHDFLKQLHSLPKFSSAWSLLLAHLEDSCLRSSQEVSLASIKSFKNIVTLPPDYQVTPETIQLWQDAWVSWLTIGDSMVAHAADDTEERYDKKELDPELQHLTLSLSSSSVAPISKDFSQDMLTAYMSMFSDLYRVISPKFTIKDVESLLEVMRNVLIYSTSPQYRPDIDNLSPLQEAVLAAVQTLDLDAPGVVPLVLRDLSEYMTLAFLSPNVNEDKKNTYVPPSQRRFSTVTYIALNKKCSKMVADLFLAHVKDLDLYTEGVFERIVGAYGLPMKMKYDCPPSYKHGDDKMPLWKVATTGLLDILQAGLKTLHEFDEEVPLSRFEGVWRTLVDILEGSLLSPSTPPSSMSIDELDVDEHFDISVLSVIQNDIVIYIGQPRVPVQVIEKLVGIVRESSRLYYIDESSPHRSESQQEAMTNELGVQSDYRDVSNDRSSDIMGTTGTIVPVMKESFAYAALKTLFGFCSAEKQDYPEVRKRIAKVAIPILLERCETVFRNYTADEPLLGRCPFPRVRKEEMLFFLRQCLELKLQEHIFECSEADKGSVKEMLLSGPRAHLFYLYPALCRMITCDDPVVVGLIQNCLEAAGAEVGLGCVSAQENVSAQS